MRNIFTLFRRLTLGVNSLSYRLGRIPLISNSTISTELVRDCLAREDPTILEIGCNDGTHTQWFLEMFESPRVYCFEPDPRAIARFKAKVGRRSNVQLTEIALSNQNGELIFYQSGGQRSEEHARVMPEGWDKSGSIRRPKKHLSAHPWVTFDERIVVKTSTLDAWCDKQRISFIDLIWMDVQGAEIDVFCGAENALARTRFVYTEYSDDELYEGQFNLRQLIRYLRAFKFDVVTRYPGDVLFENRRFKGSD